MNLDKRLIFKIIIIVICFVLLLISLFFIRTSKNSDYKIFKNEDFIVEEKTEYVNDYITGLPIINVNTEEVRNLNKDISSIYYDLALFNDFSLFSYKYTIYDNVLVLFISTTKYDDSEYGKIDYYSYYVDLNDFKVLTSDKFLSRISVSYREVNNIIDNRLRSYYNKDSFKSSMDFIEYKDFLLKNKDYAYFINNNVLYLYVSLNYTKDLIESTQFGNIYEFKIMNL